MNKKIGIFDSGYGGLTILEGIRKELPNYSYLYLGDNVRAPYGDLSQQKVFDYTCQAVDFLFQKNCEIIIIACNTVSAKALRKLQKKYINKESQQRILGVVIPLLEEIEETVNGCEKKVCIIGTRATIKSGVFQKEIKIRSQKVKVFSKSCPLLVPMIESEQFEPEKMNEVLKKYLKRMSSKKIDYLILACTHFHYLEKNIKVFFDKETKIIETPKVIARKLKEYFKNHQDIKKKISIKKSLTVYTTGDKRQFIKFFKNNYNSQVKVKKISLA
ncbi:MAG: glutamate racemase [Candidatus Gastranaerophilaceae bacterium]|jgi:glutamate racemase